MQSTEVTADNGEEPATGPMPSKPNHTGREGADNGSPEESGYPPGGEDLPSAEEDLEDSTHESHSHHSHLHHRHPSDTGIPVPPVIVPRWIQLVLLPLALLGLWALARASGTVLLILIAASTVALILNPVVRILEKTGLRRGLAILLVYLGGLAAIVRRRRAAVRSDQHPDQSLSEGRPAPHSAGK